MMMMINNLLGFFTPASRTLLTILTNTNNGEVYTCPLIFNMSCPFTKPLGIVLS